jgi:hypothetical protein
MAQIAEGNCNKCGNSSVITSKAANDYHFKTGQRERRPGHWMFYPAHD